MRLPQALITELIPEEFLWGVDSTGFSLTIMWHFFTFRDIIYFEFFRGRPLVTRKNSNYFSTNSTWMFSKMDNSPSPDSEKLTFWCPRPSFFEFWVFFAHTNDDDTITVTAQIELRRFIKFLAAHHVNFWPKIVWKYSILDDFWSLCAQNVSHGVLIKSGVLLARIR